MAHLDEFDEDDFNVAPMFGDPFGNRGDYSKGIFYGGRRRFLHGSREDNHLQPPEIFMTRDQKKRLVLGEKGENDKIVLQKFDFVDKAEVAVEKSKFSKKESSNKKKHRKKKDITFIEKYSSTRREDWIEEVQAGCRLYVNKATGEVSDECPWDEASNKLLVPGSPACMVPSPDRYRPQVEEDEVLGTGSLVYSEGALSEIFDMLDATKAKEDRMKAGK